MLNKTALTILATLAIALGLGPALGWSQRQPTQRSLPQEPGPAADTAGLILTGTDGLRYEGPPAFIQVAESADPPVQASLTAAAANGATWTATFGLSIETLSMGEATIEVARRPLHAGGGVVTQGPSDRRVTAQRGRIQLQIGPDRVFNGRADVDAAGLTFTGRYVLSCWVRPETLGLRPNGTGPVGSVERVEDATFQSDFCKRLLKKRG